MDSKIPASRDDYSERELNAMMTLLDDDDASVVENILYRLKLAGPRVLQWIDKNRWRQQIPVRRRLESILDENARSRADNEFLEFILRNGEFFDLEEGVWRFVRTRYPLESIVAWVALFDSYADGLRDRVSKESSGPAILDSISELLFGQLGLKGNQEQFYEAENSYLNRVMERRLGIPISLCTAYLFIAKRLALPVSGIAMPGHFLCRYQTPQLELYVDAFHGGKLLSRAACIQRLRAFNVSHEEVALTAISPRRILQRTVANIHLIRQERGETIEAERLQRYLVALSR